MTPSLAACVMAAASIAIWGGLAQAGAQVSDEVIEVTHVNQTTVSVTVTPSWQGMLAMRVYDPSGMAILNATGISSAEIHHIEPGPAGEYGIRVYESDDEDPYAHEYFRAWFGFPGDAFEHVPDAPPAAPRPSPVLPPPPPPPPQ